MGISNSIFMDDDSSSVPSRRNVLLAIAAIVVLLIAVYAVMHVTAPAPTSFTATDVELASATSTSWYRLSGDTLQRTDAPKDADRARDISSSTLRIIAPGRPLGFLPDGSLLALTADRIVQVSVADGSFGQTVLHLGSSTPSTNVPLAAASPDLVFIALENPLTHTVDVYRLDVSALQSKLIGSATIPGPAAQTLPADDVARALSDVGIKAASGTPKTLTMEEAQTVGRRIALLPSYKQATTLAAVGLSTGALYVRTETGLFYRFALTNGTLGEAVPLTLKDAE